MSAHSPSTPPQAAEPVTVVIFGASGDLTQRKLVPALYNLFREGLLPRRLRVEAAWAFITPILARWAEADAPPPASYAEGSWGPEPAEALLTREGRQWRRP